MSPWTIYWVLMLDSIVGLSVALAVSLGFVAAITMLVRAIGLDDGDMSKETGEKVKNVVLKFFVPAFVVTTLVATFTPNTKQAVAIWVVPKVVNNEHVQDISENSMKLLDEKLEGWVEKIKEDQEKED